MIQRLFEWRNLLKQKIHTKQESDMRHLFINERETRYAHLGINIGYEENGKGEDAKRPVLVIRKIGNLFLILPMTTKGKSNRYYYHLPMHIFNKESWLILSQIRVIDKKRFIEKLETLDVNLFSDIKKKLTALCL